jgi:hypothetical protein
VIRALFTRRPRPAAGLFALALLAAAAAAAPVHAAPGGAASITVEARPGSVERVQRALGRTGLRVHRRAGVRLQVVADPARVLSLRRLPGVAAVRPADAAFGDQLEQIALSQGLKRTGALALQRAAGGGAGLVIAILDLGFGTNLEALQAVGELPPPTRLESVSFDPAAGLAGANAYGNRTNHGELVAQTVHDYAPRARYVFVNYHSEADFVAATDWLVQRRPDIVVHSNNFLEGPFDGSGPLAQAVDRASAAGILWFNSAGNYAERHWSGVWADADGDRVLDWPDPTWTFTRNTGQPVTFALSWPQADPGRPTDLDLAIERRADDGTWVPGVASADRQAAGAAPAERVTGWRAPVTGTYRVRVAHVSGPPPGGPLTLFSREIPLAPAGGSHAGSIPTPADARGAIAVGAVDWRGDRLRRYSSNGPSDDGRLKPDLVAPTDTVLLGPSGLRGVGGTSNAAPNAAGAAALMLAADRRAGIATDAATIRARLAAMALDLGVPGPDMAFGAGRVRATTDGPELTARTPAPGAAARRVVMARFAVTSPIPVVAWNLGVDDTLLVTRTGRGIPPVRIDTRRLPDGVHRLRVSVRDMAGNVGVLRWPVRVDNTAPRIRLARLVAPRGRATGRPRPLRLRLRVHDGDSARPLDVSLRLLNGPRTARTLKVRPGPLRTVALGRFRAGRVALRIEARDAAGNRHVLLRRTVLR